MDHRFGIGLLLLLLVSLAPAQAQPTVGTVDAVTGVVQIDTYGNGEFIQARVDDLLYDQTIVRTRPGSSAVIRVDGSTHYVVPDTEVVVSGFRDTRARTTAPGVLRRLFQGVRNFLAPPGEVAEDTGTKASDQGGAARAIGTSPENSAGSGFDQFGFAVDPEDSQAFVEAHGAFVDGDYRRAGEAFARIEFPDESDFDPVEYYVEYTYSLIQTGNYQSALAIAFRSVNSTPGADPVPWLDPRIQLLAGIAAFMLLDDELATVAIDQYLAGVPMNAVAPEAVATKVAILRANGEIARADELLRDARAAQPSFDWSSLLGE